jgi:hypothetical protein
MTVSEWDRRELCPDGGCVGVIGADGLCKTCGRAAENWGDERQRGLVSEPVAKLDASEVDDDDDGDDDDAEHPDADLAPTAGADVEAYEWSRRKLCSDGTCVGVIGANGRCKACGKAA